MNPTRHKIRDHVDAATQAQAWKKDGQKVVFTNGCFDILHRGHIDYLEKARSLGDKLVVGLNTDISVTKIKGKGRPITDELSRSQILAALEFVDLVVLFDQNTPLELISSLVPDILVKGKDYDISNIVGANVVLENGGSVETIEIVEGYSTTTIINKIKTIE